MTKTGSSKSTNDDHNTTVIGNEHLSQDVNTDERFSVANADHHALTYLNQKRTYDLHQTLDTDGILAARKQADAEASMRLRHAEEEHHQKMRHENDLHTIRVQTLSVSSVGNSKIVENIATETAEAIVGMVKSGMKK